MSVIKLTLPRGEIPVTGKQVTFTAPCTCIETEALQIDGVQYTVVDSLCNCVTGIGGRWVPGAVVSVILDTENQRAYLQNEPGGITAETASILGLGNGATVDEAIRRLADKTMLSEETAAKYGFAGENITVDNAFDALADSIIAQGVTTLYVLDEDGNGLPSVAIDGVTSVNGGAVSTDATGKAQIILTATVDVTLSVDFADIPDCVATIVPNYGELNEVSVVMPYAKAGRVDVLTESHTLNFRKARTANLSIVGGGTGGEGGGHGDSRNEDGDAEGGPYGFGGEGGKVYNPTGVTLSGSMVLAVGAGGAAGKGVPVGYDNYAYPDRAGKAGGKTTFGSMSSESGSASTVPIGGISAGGSGGSGGWGGYYWGSHHWGSKGSDGVRGGGKGGDGDMHQGITANGTQYIGNPTIGEAGKLGGGGGGGGGGSAKYADNTQTAGTNGGKGGSGCLIIEWL
jgi:hypothetical protein